MMNNLSKDPDLILLDIMLPDCNGVDLLPKIKGVKPNLPVIMLSAQGSIEVALSALRNGAFDYFPKPIDNNRLEPAIKNAISVAGVGINTWDGTNFNVDVALADTAEYYNSLLSEMQLNNYSGAMDEAFNTTFGATARTQVNQGQANATNTAFQYDIPFDRIIL